MSYDVYRYIFIGAAILFGAMLLVAILLFFILKIPKIISDLTGATARKAIKNIREQNEGNGSVTYAGSSYNASRGKLTDRMTQTGSVMRNGLSTNMNMNTAKIAMQPIGGDETTLLEQPLGNETTLLDTFNTTQALPSEEIGGTTLLTQERSSIGETTVLGDESTTVFSIEYEIIYIHTQEVIGTEAYV